MLVRRRIAMFIAAAAAAALVPGAGAAQAAGAAGAPTVTEVTGRLETVVVDPGDGSPTGARHTAAGPARHTAAQTRTVVETGGRLLEVPTDVAAQRLAGTRSGDRVRIRLQTPKGGRAQVVAATPTGRRAAAAPNVLGAHTMTLLPVYFTSPDSQTQATLQNLADLTANFWTQQSSSKITMTAVARDWKQVANPSSCDYTAIFNAALAAHGMTNPTGLFQHVVVYFPRRADCQWAGLGSVLGTRTWINGYPYVEVIAHELGHNFGIGHANTATCTIGGVRVSLSSSCTNTEYGDSVDVMGSGAWNNQPGNLNVALADHLGLATVTRISAGSSTSTTVAPTAQLTANRAVRIDLPSGVPVYVEYRPAAGADFRAASWAGVQVRQRVSPSGYPASQLLDMQPATSFSKVSLPTWAVWPVPGTGLSVKVTDVGAGGATVSVVPTANDTAAPPKVTPISPAAGRTVGTGSSVTWTGVTDTGGAGTAAYAIWVDGTLRARVGATTTTWALPTLTEGNHTVRVDAVDNAGITSTGTLVTFTVSGSAGADPAQVTAPADNGYTGSSTTVRWTVPAPTAAAVLLDGQVAATVESGITEAALTGLTDGRHTIAVASRSAAGATTSTSGAVTVTADSTAPTAPTGLTLAAGKATWGAAGDATSGVAGYRLTVDNGSPRTTTATTIPLTIPDGVHTVSVRAVDRAGNQSAAATAQYVKDGSAPTGLRVTAPAADAVLGSRTVTLTWTAAADPQSGVTGYRLLLPGAAPVSLAADARSAEVTLPEGRSTVKVRALNAAGGFVEAAVRVTVDTLAPAVPTGLSATADGTKLRWTGATRDGGSTVSFRVAVDGGAEVTAATATLALSLAPGLHTFAVRAVDAVGNASAAATLERWVDPSAPAAPTLTAPANNAVSGSRTVALTWSASTDPESGLSSYLVSVNGRRLAPLGADAVGTSVLAPADGQLVVLVAAVNRAGLVSAWTKRTVLVDTRAPVPPTKLALAGSGAVTWTATTDAGAPVSFQVSLDGAAATTVSTPTFTVGPPGQHTVAVTAIDAAGNTSTARSVTGWVDASAPTAPSVLTPTTDTWVATRTPVLTWSAADDPQTGVAGYRISVNGRVVLRTTGTGTTAKVPVPEGRVTVAVAAVNPAGTASPAGTISLTVDSTKPKAPAGASVSAGGVLSWGASTDPGAAPSGVERYVVYLDGVEVARVDADAGRTRSVTTPAGKHVWAVAALDAVGNVSTRTSAPAVTR